MELERSTTKLTPVEPVDQISELDAADAFAALGSDARLTILRALVRAGDDGLAVGALQERLAMPGSTLSHHLRAMMQAGLVEQTRQGRTLVCRAQYDRVQVLADFLVSECCADQSSAERKQA